MAEPFNLDVSKFTEPIAKLWGDEWQSHFEAIFGVE